MDHPELAILIFTPAEKDVDLGSRFEVIFAALLLRHHISGCSASTDASPTPLTNQVQQTYFEHHKKSMPELDVWTPSELQWGALDCDVLGMFYADSTDMRCLAFSGDVNNVVSAHRYKVFAPATTWIMFPPHNLLRVP